MEAGGELDLRTDPKLATQVFVSSSSNPKDLLWGVSGAKGTTFSRNGAYSGLKESVLDPIFNHHSWQRSKNPSPPFSKLICVLKPLAASIAVFPTQPVNSEWEEGERKRTVVGQLKASNTRIGSTSLCEICVSVTEGR